MSLADQEAKGWANLANASHLRRVAPSLPPTDDPIRQQAREQLGREPSVEEYFAAAAAQAAADGHEDPTEAEPHPDAQRPAAPARDAQGRFRSRG